VSQEFRAVNIVRLAGAFVFAAIASAAIAAEREAPVRVLDPETARHMDAALHRQLDEAMTSGMFIIGARVGYERSCGWAKHGDTDFLVRFFGDYPDKNKLDEMTNAILATSGAVAGSLRRDTASKKDAQCAEQMTTLNASADEVRSNLLFWRYW